jgi:hypothetical protein
VEDLSVIRNTLKMDLWFSMRDEQTSKAGPIGYMLKAGPYLMEEAKQGRLS